MKVAELAMVLQTADPNSEVALAIAWAHGKGASTVVMTGTVTIETDRAGHTILIIRETDA